MTFIGYKQTNKQTDTQTDKPNLYIDKFLETRTLDRTNIGRDQLLKILGFSIYPLSFSFTVPFYTFEKSASEVPFSKTSSLGVKAPTPSKRIPKKKMLLSEDDN